MIKKIILCSFFALTLGSSAAAQSIKICVYDPEVVMAKAKEWADSIAAIDKKYQRKFDELKKEEESLRDAASKFQAKAGVMKEDARDSEQNELVRRKRKLDTEAEAVLEEYKVERQKVSMRFFKKLEEGIRGFAQANSYDLVLPKGPGIYASNSTDQSEALTSYLNSSYEGGKNSGGIVAKK